MTLTETACRIREHLKRIEADPNLNPERSDRRGKLFWNAGAGRSGSRAYVRYVSYQGTTYLTRVEAEAYLKKLDEGFVGRHFEALREKGS